MINDGLKKKGEQFQKEGASMSLKLFREAARRVPAYKDFLKKNKINPEKIKNFGDLKNIPITSKKNYLTQYTLPELSWDGSLKKPLVFTATSGSTGEPYYFPRTELVDSNAAELHSIFLNYALQGEVVSTLVIDAFGMGIWIGGLITYKAFEILSRKRNIPLSIITPGINKKEILNILSKLSPYYGRTIICGYPPFVKDVLEEAKQRDINLGSLNLKFVFAAESFSENFRDYISEIAQSKNLLLDYFHVYGSADIGAMAAETPISVLIKRVAIKNDDLFISLFGQKEKIPTFAQFIPKAINFEEEKGEVILTGNSALPLIKYSIGDKGGVVSFKQVKDTLTKYKTNIKQIAKLNKIENTVTELPFVYIYERTDFAVSLYGIIIYPAYIREILVSKKLVKYLSGRFTMSISYDRNENQYLKINLELKHNIKATKKIYDIVQAEILAHMTSRSSEFNELVKNLKERAYPKIELLSFGDPRYFNSGVKQRWVIN